MTKTIVLIAALFAASPSMLFAQTAHSSVRGRQVLVNGRRDQPR
jgi:hypothetical protein